MKLAAKLMMIFLLAALPMMTLSSYLTVQREMQRLARAQEQKTRSIANDIQGMLVNSYQQGGLEKLVSALRTYATPLQPLRVRWVWFNAPQDNPMTPKVPFERIAESVLDGKPISIPGRGEDGVGQLHTYFPLPLERSRLGGLEVTGSLQEFERGRRETVYNTLMSVGGMALVCVVIVIGAGVQLVGKPLNQLIKKTQQIGRSDLPEPLSLPGRDELSELAMALNEMSDRLHQQQHAIESETSKRLATLKQLRHANRLKTVGRLAAGIAHELGTPLNVISGRAALIGSGKLSNREIEKSATTIKSEADRITGIIRQLLDFARQNQPQQINVVLLPIVQHTIELLHSLAAEAGVEIQFSEDGQPYQVCVDQGQIQQVLTNIVVNAVQAIQEPPGTVSVMLLRSPSRADKRRDIETIMIAVEDSGCGIAQTDLEHLFEPFFTTKDVGEGTGLGLSIAFGMIEEHGGWIDVTSTVGSGSRFEIHLPLGEPV